MTSLRPEISVVIPVYNEVENVPDLHRELTRALEGLGRPYEIIVVDDGSQDGTLDRLLEIEAGDPRLRVLRLRRNFGQTAAFSAGFDHARGDVVVTSDGDLQNDPADIPMLVAKLDEGFDLVCGWRHHRQDTLSRRLPSQLANRLISWATGVELHDYGCSLKAMRVEVVRGIKLYGEMHRFIPAVASWMGVNAGPGSAAGTSAAVGSRIASLIETLSGYCGSTVLGAATTSGGCVGSASATATGSSAGCLAASIDQ